MDVHLITADPALLSALERDAQISGVHIASRTCLSPDTSLASQLARIHQGVVLLEDTLLMQDADWEALTAQTHMPSIRLDVVLLSRDAQQGVLMRAMRAGIREVLACPPAPEDLRTTLHRFMDLQQERQAGSAPQQPGRLMAFIGCKGGVGTSFLATTLAQMAAADFHCPCAFMDLDLLYGDASFYLGSFEHPNTLADVAVSADRLDAQLLSSCMYSAGPGLKALAAPASIDSAMNISAQHIASLLSLACQTYPLVVVDLPRNLDTSSLKALAMADKVCLVMDDTLAALRDARRLLQRMRSLGLPHDTWRLLVNRIGDEDTLDRKRIEDSLGLRILQCIPEQRDVVRESVHLGRPIGQLHPRDRVTLALKRTAADLLGQPLPATPSWLSRWFPKSRSAGSLRTAGASLET